MLQVFLYIFEVAYRGQVIGGIVAVDKVTADRAVTKVNVVYEELPHVITIEV